MEVSYYIFPADVRRNFRHSISRAPGSALFLFSLFSVVPIAMLSVLLWDAWSRHTPIIATLVITAAIFTPLLLLATIIPMHALEQLYPKGKAAPFNTTEITSNCLRFDKRRIVSENELILEPVEALWSEVSGIHWQNGDIAFLCSGRVSNNFVPRSAFATPQEAELFYNTARQHWEAVKYRTAAAGQDQIVWPPAPAVGNSTEPDNSPYC